jgi:hypothetical protein
MITPSDSEDQASGRIKDHLQTSELHFRKPKENAVAVVDPCENDGADELNHGRSWKIPANRLDPPQLVEGSSSDVVDMTVKRKRFIHKDTENPYFGRRSNEGPIYCERCMANQVLPPWSRNPKNLRLSRI